MDYENVSERRKTNIEKRKDVFDIIKCVANDLEKNGKLGSMSRAFLASNKGLLITSADEHTKKMIRSCFNNLKKRGEIDKTFVNFVGSERDFSSLDIFSRMFCFRNDFIVFENPEEYLFNDEDNIRQIKYCLTENERIRPMSSRLTDLESYLLNTMGLGGFVFNGFVIMVTEKSLDEIRHNRKIEPHFNALSSRVSIFVFENSDEY